MIGLDYAQLGLSVSDMSSVPMLPSKMMNTKGFNLLTSLEQILSVSSMPQVESNC